MEAALALAIKIDRDRQIQDREPQSPSELWADEVISLLARAPSSLLPSKESE